MLDFFRNRQTTIMIKVVYALIILSFVIGYTMLTSPDGKSNDGASDIAATVNGDEISYSSFQTAYSNLYNLYQNIYQGSFNSQLEKQLNLPGQAMQQLLREQLLAQQADKLGLSVTRQEMVDSIAAIDAFQVNGNFDRDRYIEVLQYQRLSAEQFETMQQRQLLVQKVQQQLQQGVTVNADELEAAYHQNNDKVDLDFVWLTSELVENKVKVDDQALAAFFKENAEQFRIPEKVSLRYLQFDPARYQDEVASFSDEELDRYYRRNLSQFEIAEEVKAAHILLKLDADADEATIAKRRELAEQLLAQLKDGADFAKLAKSHSDDTATAENGGELGSFGRGVMVKPFDEAVFALRPGQLSDIVRTQFGFHIIKVEQYTAAGIIPFADALAEVKAGLMAEKTAQLAYEKAIDAYNMNRKTADLDAAAKENNLGIKETGLFARNQAIDGIGRNKAITDAAFTLAEGELAKPVQVDNSVFLFSLKQRQASYLPELAEVRAQVEQAYRSEQSHQLAKELADQLLALAKEKNNLTAAAKQLKLPLEASGPFSRGFGAFIPRIGNSQELADAAFSLSAEKPVADAVYSIADRYLVAALKEATVADFNDLDEAGRSQLKEQLLQSKKEQQLNDKLNQLLEQAQIEIFVPELANALPARS